MKNLEKNKITIIETAQAARAIEEVNYHALKNVACDYVKSRVASGGLTKPP